MPRILSHVTDGEPITDGLWNTLVDQVNALMSVRGDGIIDVVRGPGSILIRANLPPNPRPFLVVQDTPDGQGYVTAHWLRWNPDQNIYATDQDAGDQTIYDPAAGITNSSYSGPDASSNYDPQSLPFYGNSGTRITSRWSKAGFSGDARWDAGRGVWVIERIEHVARFINFSYSGTGDYSFGSPDTNLSVTSFWDGLDPTKTKFGDEGETNQIAVVNSPDAGFVVKGGDSGTAVWRDDLDNSTSWQYQIIDGGECPD